mgnify:CR=1 FL=1
MNLTNLTLPLDRLMLDPNNYRLDYKIEEVIYSDEEVVGLQEKTLDSLEKEKLGELRSSILQNGFLEMDRVVVRRLNVEDEPGLYLVVEGNRRIAALKGLFEDYLEGDIHLPGKVVEKIKSIGVICISGTEDDISEFSAGLMGMRHVSGPKRWTGYQSARLIGDRHKAGDSFPQIGALLGISDLEAERRFKNYRAFLQMKSDEEYGDRMLQKHYTLLSEFLSPSRYAREWLGWEENKDLDTYKFTNRENLHRVYGAITSTGGKRAEINNVNQAREFLTYLESDEHREMIERNMKLQDLPPLKLDEECRLKKIKDFIYLIGVINDIEVSKDELNLLNTAHNSLHQYLKKGVGNDC